MARRTSRLNIWPRSGPCRSLTVVRPGDATETAVAWEIAIQHRDGPIALVLTRQKLPVIDRTKFAPAEMVKKGGYILGDAPNGKPQVILMATGSEVSLAMSAWEKLNADGIATRIVSLPSWELFDAQPEDYRRQVLPPEVKARLAIEAASPFGWQRYVGDAGDVIGMTTFGASAPLESVMPGFGFTTENVVSRARALLKR